MRSMLSFHKAITMVCISGLMLISVFLMGCGASRQQANNGDTIDIDELLGEEQSAQSGQNADEGEVLKLLGITPAEEQGTDVTQPEAAKLEEDIENLKQELLSKDQQISELRSEITQREKEINELEEMAETSKQPQQRNLNFSGQANAPSPDFRARYQSALNVFKAREYQSAITAFSDLLSSDPNNTLSDNCQYWLGECYYGLGNYNQAISEFEKVFLFPNTNKADDAQLKLGISYLKLGERQQARGEFQRLLSSYPQSEYISLAEKYLAKL